MVRRFRFPWFSCGLLALAVGACSTTGDGKDDGDVGDSGTDDDSPDPDGDGYEWPEDCDPGNADVHPDADEDCFNDIDDNCDGIITSCLEPTLIYEPLNPAGEDPYGVGVYADYVLFGEPSGTGFASIDDGRAVFFDLEPGVVSELDAALQSDGPVGETGAYGVVITPVGDALCIGADYHDNGNDADAGKTWCFDQNTVRSAAVTLDPVDAEYWVEGEHAFGYSTMEAEADVDGDGLDDLLVYTSVGIDVILGDGTGWSGGYSVPSDADLTLGDCATSNTGWCGFGRALQPASPATLAIAGEGGTPDTISLYDLPLAGGSTIATATSQLDRGTSDSATGVEHIPGFAFGNSDDGEIQFLDDAGALVGTLDGPGETTAFGHWSSTLFDQDGHELLLVSAPEENAPGSSGEGVVYVFDLTANGLPDTTEQATHVLVAPDGFERCGWRARGGIVSDADGSSTTVALSCPGWGGAAYALDHRPPPPPPLGAQAVVQIGQDHYQIKRSAIDAYTSRIEWVMSLAQVQPVFVQGSGIVGWRLSDIEVDSPLYRAGLRSEDVLRNVNGVPLTTPEVIQGLYQSLMNANELSVGLTRNGVPRERDFSIVP